MSARTFRPRARPAVLGVAVLGVALALSLAQLGATLARAASRGTLSQTRSSPLERRYPLGTQRVCCSPAKPSGLVPVANLAVGPGERAGGGGAPWVPLAAAAIALAAVGLAFNLIVGGLALSAQPVSP